MHSLMMKNEIVTTFGANNISDDSFNVTFEKYSVVTFDIISVNKYKPTFAVICPTFKIATAIGETVTCATATSKSNTISISFIILILYCFKNKERKRVKKRRSRRNEIKNEWRKKEEERKGKRKRIEKKKKIHEMETNCLQFAHLSPREFKLKDKLAMFFEIYYLFFNDHSHVRPYFSIQIL